MKIFLSWSGEKSKYIAENLSNWLEQVLQVAEPWISTDIEKGKRWSNEIATELKESKVAIICLTNDNLDSNWIHFEAGAIAKTEDAYICTFLYNVNPTNVQQPLSQFQNTKFQKSDILKLIKTINNKIGISGGKPLKDSNLESVFNTFWPQLEEKLSKIPESKKSKIIRTDRELLEESLQILRILKNNNNNGNLSGIDETVDFYIKIYAEQNNIPHNSSKLNGHELKCSEFIRLYIPTINGLFNSEKEFINKVKERIEDLLPF